MRKRLIFILIVSIVNMVIFTGCWDYVEIDKLNIVAGVAIDRSEQGMYKITTEIVDLHEGSKEAKINSKKLESYGDTLFDAIRNTIKISPEKLYWGHCEIVIVSQVVAREGVSHIIDFLSRDAEPRLSIDILVSKEKTAEEILVALAITSEIRSYEINKMIDAQRYLSKAPLVRILDFINNVSNYGISAVAPSIGVVENNNKSTFDISGLAVFKRDRLVGFLDGDETQAFLFATDKLKGGIINLKEDSRNGNANISLEIVDSKSKIKPVYKNGKLSIDIEIKTKTKLAEDGTEDGSFGEKQRLRMKNEANKQIETNITNIIQRVQKDFGEDIFGFGKIVRADKSSLWKEIYPNWSKTFCTLEVNVTSNVEIQDSGLLSKRIIIGD